VATKASKSFNLLMKTKCIKQVHLCHDYCSWCS